MRRGGAPTEANLVASATRPASKPLPPGVRLLLFDAGKNAVPVQGAGSVHQAVSDDESRSVSGPGADRATTAALQVTHGGTGNAVEQDSENGATWEVEVTKPNGKTVDVRLDANYGLVVVEGDSERGERGDDAAGAHKQRRGKHQQSGRPDERGEQGDRADEGRHGDRGDEAERGDDGDRGEDRDRGKRDDQGERSDQGESGQEDGD